jgi:tetratricopeptide (TPR) repeat protein
VTEDDAAGPWHRQVNAAAGEGQVFAVQGGDQYNYIYRGTPPYRVEPFLPGDRVPPPAGLARVPSRLLMARHRVVPFFARPETAVLQSWRDDPAPGVTVRLLHAEGGQGKTRLAVEFAAESARAGWTVAMARHRSEVAAAGGRDQSLAVRAPGLVLVVDYAERWPFDDLVTLVRQHRDAARHRLRILLLARPTGTWWQALTHQFAKLDIFDADAVRLAELPEDRSVRAEVYTAARDSFAKVLGMTDRAGVGTATGTATDAGIATGLGIAADLDDPVFSLTLTVHMRALVDVDAATRGRLPPKGSDQAALSSYLLDREHDYWRSSHHGGRGPLRTGARTMGRAVYVATLTRPLDPGTAAAVLKRAKVTVTSAGAGRVLREHARHYPPQSPGLVLEPLYPDRLGEDFVALTLPGREEEFAYHATDPWAASASGLLLAPAGGGRNGLGGAGEVAPPYTRQAVSVLVEAAHRWPHVAADQLEPLLRDHPSLAVAAGSSALVRLAELPDVDLMMLAEIAKELPAERRLDLDVGAAAIFLRLTAEVLPPGGDSGAQANAEAEAPADAEADELAEAEADLLLDTSWRCVNAGLHRQAVDTAERAVAVRRSLARKAPAAHLPDLASALSWLGACYSGAGRVREAMEAALEAVERYLALYAQDPAAHLGGLAAAGLGLSHHSTEAGMLPGALRAAQVTVTSYRKLAEDSDADHRVGLAKALNNLSAVLHAQHQTEQAREYADEALAIHRELAAGKPAAHGGDLTVLLHNQSILQTLSDPDGRPSAQALRTAHDAVVEYRRLAAVNQAAYEPPYAQMLNTYAGLLTLAEAPGALQAADEAVTIYRRLAAENPQAHSLTCARILLTYAEVHLEARESVPQVLEAVDEAIDIYGSLPDGASEAFYLIYMQLAAQFKAKALELLDRHEEAGHVWAVVDEIARARAELPPDAPSTS